MPSLDPVRERAREDSRGPAVEGPALSGEMVRWCWGDLDRVVDRTAARLVEAGVGPGDRVGTLLPPGPELVVILHALPRIGALLQPLHPRWEEGELGRVLEGSGRPPLLLAPGERVSGLRSRFPRVGTVAVEEVVSEDGLSCLRAPEEDPLTDVPALPPPDTDTPLALLLTSGSTGRPRPIPLTHGNLMASAVGARERLRLDPADRWLASLSPSHVGGLALLHRAAVVGCALVTRPGFDPEELLELAETGQVTHASLVPVMLRRTLEARGGRPAPRSLRCVLLGGAATPRPLLAEALSRRWPVALTYGLSEASSQVATAAPDQVRRKPGSVGRPLSGVAVRVADPDSNGVGEILVQGPTVAPLSGSSAPTEEGGVWVDPGGWLHTGDLGRMDEDGDLWITGRASQRIVSGGVTVEPGEVEAVLQEHPGVAEVAVLGVPDPEWGERVTAVVVPADPNRPPTLEALLDFSRSRLGSAKRPRELRIRSQLPRNAHGKVDRGRLRDAPAGQDEPAATAVDEGGPGNEGDADP